MASLGVACSSCIMRGATCCEWCLACGGLRSGATSARRCGMALSRVVQVILGVVQCLVGLVVALVRIGVNLAVNFWPFLVALLGALVGAYLLQLFWPYIAEFLNATLIPIINVIIDILCFVFQLLITIYRILSMIWNLMVPFIGMILYVIVTLLVALFKAIFAILGAVDIMALLSAVLKLMMAIASIYINITVAMTKAGVPVMMAFADVIGPLCSFVFQNVGILLDATMWLYGPLFEGLEPVLDAVLALVSFSGSASAFRARRLLSMEDEWDAGDSHRSMPVIDTATEGFFRALHRSVARLRDSPSANVPEIMSRLHAIRKAVERSSVGNRRLRDAAQATTNGTLSALAALGLQAGFGLDHAPFLNFVRPLSWAAADVVDNRGNSTSVPSVTTPRLSSPLPPENSLGNRTHARRSVAENDYYPRSQPVTQEVIVMRDAHAEFETATASATLIGRAVYNEVSEAAARYARDHHDAEAWVRAADKTLAVMGYRSVAEMVSSGLAAARRALENSTIANVESPEELVMALSPEGTALHAYLAQFDPDVGTRRFWSAFHTQVRDARFSRLGPGRRASTGRRLLQQEFAIMAETDCFSSDPRNPLCLPDVPQNFSFCPGHFYLPANVSGNETCPGYIATSCVWCPARFYNAFVVLRTVASTVTAFVTWTRAFSQIFPFASWLSSPFSVYQPGFGPVVLDFICALLHAYDVLVVVATFYIGYLVLWPLVEWLAGCLGYWSAAANFNRMQRLLAERDWDTRGYDIDQKLMEAYEEYGVRARRIGAVLDEEGDGQGSLGSTRGKWEGITTEGARAREASRLYDNDDSETRRMRTMRSVRARFDAAQRSLESVFGTPTDNFGSSGRMTLTTEEHVEALRAHLVSEELDLSDMRAWREATLSATRASKGSSLALWGW